jgi:hypothetical protein
MFKQLRFLLIYFVQDYAIADSFIAFYDRKRFPHLARV